MIRWFYNKSRSKLARIRGYLIRLLILVCGGKCGPGLSAGKGIIFKYAPHKGIDFGANIRIGEYVTIDAPEGSLLILGNHVKFTMGCVIASSQKVFIGDDTLVGEYSSIRDADHRIEISQLIREQSHFAEDVYIGTDVWIGRGVTVLKGSYIDNGAVIGANSLVKGKIVSNSIAVGTPARSISERKNQLQFL